jgi:hypothetical protein
MSTFRGAVARATTVLVRVVLVLGLAACSAAGPAAPASVGPSAAPPSTGPSPSPRPSPTPKIGDLVIDRLIERITSPDFTAHVTIDAGVAVAGGTATFDAAVDVDGPNSRARITSVLEGDKITFEAIVVNGVSYTSLEKDSFVRDRSYLEAYAVNPFFHLTVDPRRVKYVAPTTIDGTAAYDARLDGAFLIHPINLGPTNVSDARLQYSEFHIFVTEEGVPIGGTLRFVGKARVGRQLQELKIDATYEFTDVGTDIVVKAP